MGSTLKNNSPEISPRGNVFGHKQSATNDTPNPQPHGNVFEHYKSSTNGDSTKHSPRGNRIGHNNSPENVDSNVHGQLMAAPKGKVAWGMKKHTNQKGTKANESAKSKKQTLRGPKQKHRDAW